MGVFFWTIRRKFWHLKIWHWLYLTALRVYRPKLFLCAASKTSDVVIEGFPRSANTYLVHAFNIATGKNFKVAHHLHDPCQIANAGKYGIPCYVIIREPLDVVISWMLKEPKLNPETILSMYISYYNFALNSGNVSFVNYKDATHKTSDVVKRIAESLGFNDHEIEMPATEEVFQVIDDIKKQREVFGRNDFDASVARPSERKESEKNVLKEEVSLTCNCLLNEANILFNEVSSCAKDIGNGV
ncbi:MAG: hypothetical protein HWE34_09660 [Methylocystaceae bacterium]|nr:hypothetical protein [Methylocystaceae bacterium]